MENTSDLWMTQQSQKNWNIHVIANTWVIHKISKSNRKEERCFFFFLKNSVTDIVCQGRKNEGTFGW